MSGESFDPHAGLSRRQSSRLNVDGRLRTRIATLHMDVEMRDVSLGGFLLASPIDITTGDIHTFEVVVPAGDLHTLRARVVHCRAPRDGEAAFLSGWRCATDDVTQHGLAAIIRSLQPADGAGTEAVEAAPAPKTVPAWELMVTTVAGNAVAGHALICPEVRYASVRWLVAAQIDRRHGDGALWRAITAELTAADEPHSLGGDSLVGALLLPEAIRTSCVLRVSDRPAIAVTNRNALTDALDHHLWRVALRRVRAHSEPLPLPELKH
jgi:hypothetical protein